MQNREKLEEEDVRSLNEFNFFEQVDNKELEQSLPRMLELIKLTISIYKKHTEE